MIHADVGLGRPIPTGLLGDGTQRVLSMALACGNAMGGTVLVDEIENGVHYSKLPHLWRAIATFAAKFEVQVFATTHSNECLSAAHEVFSENAEYPFRLFRLDRTNGEIKAKSYDRDILETAIESAMEVR